MTAQQDAKALQDTLTLFLTNAVHRGRPEHRRAAQIRRTAKAIRKRTKNKQLKDACIRVCNAIDDSLVIQAIELAEEQYFKDLN